MPNGKWSRQLRNGNAKERLEEEEENCKTCATERDIVGGASRWELRKLDVDAGWQSGSAPNAVGLPCQDCPAGACRWTNRVERTTCVLVGPSWALYDDIPDNYTECLRLKIADICLLGHCFIRSACEVGVKISTSPLLVRAPSASHPWSSPANIRSTLCLCFLRINFHSKLKLCPSAHVHFQAHNPCSTAPCLTKRWISLCLCVVCLDR
jgi:hypothetical protein